MLHPDSFIWVLLRYVVLFRSKVGQLEMDREKILQGCRDGFAACYDLFQGSAAASAFNRETDSEQGFRSDEDPSGTRQIR